MSNVYFFASLKTYTFFPFLNRSLCNQFPDHVVFVFNIDSQTFSKKKLF